MAYVCRSRIAVDADTAVALSQRAVRLLELAHDMIGILTPDCFDDKDLMQVRLAAGVGMAVLHSWIQLLHELDPATPRTGGEQHVGETSTRRLPAHTAMDGHCGIDTHCGCGLMVFSFVAHLVLRNFQAHFLKRRNFLGYFDVITMD